MKVKNREKTRFGVLPGTISISIREPGSALTHFFGLILLWIGAGPLLQRSLEHGSTSTALSMFVFILSASLLYAASTLYHSVVLDLKKTLIFRKIDHIMISVLIAGTYTPVCLTALKGPVGYLLLGSIWTLALGGILLKIFFVHCPKWLSSTLYVVMGWLCVFAMKPLYSILPLSGFLWLLFGGIAYTIGAVIYAFKLKAFNEKHIYFGSHEIFHVFIMIGTFCHYMLLYGTLAFYK